jgi:hypothetical protein
MLAVVKTDGKGKERRLKKFSKFWWKKAFPRMEKHLKVFFPVAWLAHLGLGMALGILGPVQPYLAR